MSGIIGVVQLDGSPLEPGLLRRLTDFLAFRGPDHQRIWIKHSVGLGHTLFKTTKESECDSQPLTLDGRTWIVADARIDARENLFTALKAAGEHLSESSWTDAELILRAYRVWGTDCVQHLLGDFAFGIWDDARHLLFCARDHMGVKPFYYAQMGTCVIFSNTLDCIRRHPRLSDQLNDLAIADFLLFGFNQDSTTTSFTEIQRLPPAHRAVWSQCGSQLNRYWSMPMDEPLFYNRPDDYTGHFCHLLLKCVADRLRTNRVWIFMSGGIDSPAIAATARDLLQQRYQEFDLQAITKVDEFNPDEARYASLAGRHLGVPVRFQEWTRESPNPHWERLHFQTPQPCANAWLVPREQRFWSALGPYSRVFFNGEGPDNALRLDWLAYIRYLLANRQYKRLIPTIVSTFFADRHVPFSRRITRRMNENTAIRADDFPAWLDERLESRFRLRERWKAFSGLPTSSHPLRSEGYGSLQNPLWQTFFEGFDPGSSKLSFEVRYPLADIRMLRYLLAIPALPWCRSKYLIRRAMRSHLPRALLQRPKSGPRVAEAWRYLRQFAAAPLMPSEYLETYVNLARVRHSGGGSAAFPENDFRVRSLNHWLQHSWHDLDNANEEGVLDVRCRRL